MLVDGPEIYPGYPWTIEIQIEGWDFTGQPVRSEVRTKPESSTILKSLSTQTGDIVVVSKDVLQVTISGASTETFPIGIVYFDLAQGPSGNESYIGVMIVVPVSQPVTRAS